jgi:serine/threonine protein kinase
LLFHSKDLKIGDFGLAVKYNVAATTTRPIICGTPDYIAPAVLAKKERTLKADILALRCIIYSMLAGHPPFREDSVSKTFSAINSNRY